MLYAIANYMRSRPAMHLTYTQRSFHIPQLWKNVSKWVRIADFESDGLHPDKRGWHDTRNRSNRHRSLYSRSTYKTLCPWHWTNSGRYSVIVTNPVALERHEYQFSVVDEHSPYSHVYFLRRVAEELVMHVVRVAPYRFDILKRQELIPLSRFIHWSDIEGNNSVYASRMG